MLKVPLVRQPNDTACLPTCVRAVLAYRGFRLSHDDVAEMCRTQKTGSAAELAVDGLIEAGIDAELHQFDGMVELQAALEDGRPVVAILQHLSGGTHAVVVCEISADTVTVMDPALGDYVELPVQRFEAFWAPIQSEGMLIGKAEADLTSSRRQV